MMDVVHGERVTARPFREAFHALGPQASEAVALGDEVHDAPVHRPTRNEIARAVHYCHPFRFGRCLVFLQWNRDDLWRSREPSMGDEPMPVGRTTDLIEKVPRMSKEIKKRS